MAGPAHWSPATRGFPVRAHAPGSHSHAGCRREQSLARRDSTGARMRREATRTPAADGSSRLLAGSQRAPTTLGSKGKGIKCLQQNVRKSILALNELQASIKDNPPDIILIQDPYLIDGDKNDSSSDRRDLGYSKNNSGSDYERTLGPQEAFCPLGSQTFDTRSKGCKEKVFLDNLSLFEANPEKFVSIFVTMDETWAHHLTTESKQQFMQCRHSGVPPPKKAKTVPSAGKVMVSVFWDSEGILLLDVLNKDQTITGNYYANLVKQLREAIKENRRGKLSRKIIYHQDNAPSHRSLQAMAAIYDSGFELLPHAPYSPELALSDFHLFPHLKNITFWHSF
ncbi:hypothetical protein LAZ67_15000915 [Cordylochernes scorpioides]|uniref:Transposase n=1 Tax=Cordylochernes scorpioides TaxID=51811 RepID=A0ABY6L8D0_9ARAC|nr:hypothetical protein LAZ67_15000915 [Cordylochernes scorpioides]